MRYPAIEPRHPHQIDLSTLLDGQAPHLVEQRRGLGHATEVPQNHGLVEALDKNEATLPGV